ncbi:hypothetical protein PoB_005514600 [Plakobranchus ocellatus]|uniref:Uncharacterized protein n=1 Tax=Plakobranchus ocellatus TaxID=259542 RepID=A0AAV4C7F4_9GAST|nr:hypothetical protein PoB_005514600 [Plakobranchus ocellatus]
MLEAWDKTIKKESEEKKEEEVVRRRRLRKRSPQQGDLRLSEPPLGQYAGGEARNHDRRVLIGCQGGFIDHCATNASEDKATFKFLKDFKVEQVQAKLLSFGLCQAPSREGSNLIRICKNLLGDFRASLLGLGFSSLVMFTRVSGIRGVDCFKIHRGLNRGKEENRLLV